MMVMMMVVMLLLLYQGSDQCSEMFPRLNGEDRVRPLRYGRCRRVPTQLHPAGRRPVPRHRHPQVYAGASLRPRLRVVRRGQEASVVLPLRRSRAAVVGYPILVNRRAALARC